MTDYTATPAISLQHGAGEIVIRSLRSGAADVENAASATWTAGGLIDRFSSYMLPVVISIAALGAPIPPAERRVFSRVAVSQSEIGVVSWSVDEFAYSQEMATMEQIRALDALLALPLIEGFSVHLED